MKTWLAVMLKVSGVTLVLCMAAVGGAGRLGWLGGSVPDDLGVREGLLKPPSLTPNSVSSQARLHAQHPRREDADIAPLPLINDDGPTTMAQLARLLTGMPGVTLVQDTGNGYLHAQCETRWLRFVDDLELWYDPNQRVVQVRSASRIGRSDMGVNRRRVEALRAALEER